MDAKELLRQELKKRFASESARQEDLDSSIALQDKIARDVQPEYRQDLSPRMALVDELTGSNLSRSYEAPESQQDSLRKALMYKLQQRRPDPMGNLTRLAQMQYRDEAAKAKLAGAGRRELSASDVMKIQEGNNIPVMLDDVEQVIQSNSEIFGPFEGRARQLNPYDTQGKTVESQMRAASQAFGRYMEGGVLRKEDEEKYRRMFPNLSDTPSVAQSKLQVVRRLMQQRQAGNLKALSGAGFDVRPFGGTGPEVGMPSAGGFGADGSVDIPNLGDDELDALIKRLEKGK